MRPSFNLINEPWIPCLVKPGLTQEYSLEEVLTHAHELKEIVHESPLVVASLHRLLLAILHRIFGPPNMDAWVDLWNRGAWNDDAIRGYLSQWRHRFDLFHPEYPFYAESVEYLESVSEIQQYRGRSIFALGQEFSSGNNKVLFDHNHTELQAKWHPKTTALYLLTTQNFHPAGTAGGGKSFYSAPSAKGYSVFALGDNLFQTLCLNQVVYNSREPFPSSSNDKPVWEQKQIPEHDKKGTLPTGYLDYLTWRSRKITLIANTDGEFIKVKMEQQLSLPNDFIYDPYKAYRPAKKKKDPPEPKALEWNHEVWRDSAALFQEADETAPPLIFYHLANMDKKRRDGAIECRPKYRFQVIGICTYKNAANVVLWRREVFPLPLQYLTDSGLLCVLHNTLASVEDVAKELTLRAETFAGYMLYPNEAYPGWKPNKSQDKEIKKFSDSLRPTQNFWAMLENPFRRLLVELANAWAIREEDDEDMFERVLIDWVHTLRMTAFISYKVMIRPFHGTGRGLKAIANTERGLGGKLNWIVKEHGLLEEDEEEEYEQAAG